LIPNFSPLNLKEDSQSKECNFIEVIIYWS